MPNEDVPVVEGDEQDFEAEDPPLSDSEDGQDGRPTSMPDPSPRNDPVPPPV